MTRRYLVTVHNRNGTEQDEWCDGLPDVAQFIADTLQTVKDHWNTVGVSVTWQPPTAYCDQGPGHVYEHYDRETGELECACSARHGWAETAA